MGCSLQPRGCHRDQEDSSRGQQSRAEDRDLSYPDSQTPGTARQGAEERRLLGETGRQFSFRR